MFHFIYHLSFFLNVFMFPCSIGKDEFGSSSGCCFSRAVTICWYYENVTENSFCVQRLTGVLINVQMAVHV